MKKSHSHYLFIYYKKRKRRLRRKCLSCMIFLLRLGKRIEERPPEENSDSYLPCVNFCIILDYDSTTLWTKVHPHGPPKVPVLSVLSALFSKFDFFFLTIICNSPFFKKKHAFPKSFLLLYTGHRFVFRASRNCTERKNVEDRRTCDIFRVFWKLLREGVLTTLLLLVELLIFGFVRHSVSTDSSFFFSSKFSFPFRSGTEL